MCVHPDIPTDLLTLFTAEEEVDPVQQAPVSPETVLGKLEPDLNNNYKFLQGTQVQFSDRTGNSTKGGFHVGNSPDEGDVQERTAQGRSSAQEPPSYREMCRATGAFGFETWAAISS